MPDIKEILSDAKKAGASDVHITVGASPRMRVNGRLKIMDHYARLSPAETLEIVLDIMTEQQREKFEDKGEFDMSLSLPQLGRYRVNAYKQRGSVALTFRLVDTNIPSLETLCVPDVIMELYRKTKGLILFTGPSGCGKSTTKAAVTDMINAYREALIITIEDPIEFLYHHKMALVNQREIGIDSKDYATAIRASIKEDPDVIVIGELADVDSIKAAISVAENGHLVLAEVNATSTLRAISKLIDYYQPDKQQQVRIQLAEILQAVISQRLIPNTDGNGRVAAYEVLTANRKVKELLLEDKIYEIAGAFQNNDLENSITLDESIFKLYKEGTISWDMVMQYAKDPEYIKYKMKA